MPAVWTRPLGGTGAVCATMKISADTVASPHSPQNRASLSIGAPQLEHFMATPDTERKYDANPGQGLRVERAASAGSGEACDTVTGVRWSCTVAGCLAVAALGRSAQGEEPASPPPSADAPAGDVDGFERAIFIEHIEIVGNRTTAARIIRGALGVREGQPVRAGELGLRNARYRVLALGYFREVALALRRGSRPGQVILTVRVEERGTTVLNRLWFGTSQSSTYWLGLDVTERNLGGSGIALGGGVVFAGAGQIDGSHAQWAGEVRLADASVRGSRWGWSTAFTAIRGDEPYRVSGDPGDGGAEHFASFGYRRLGAKGAATYDLSPLSRASIGLRIEDISARLPQDPIQVFPDGAIGAVDLLLHPGKSRVASLLVGYERDTRPDPVLPHEGWRFESAAQAGGAGTGSDYDFVSLLARFEGWWPLFGKAHAVGLRLQGGAVLGDAARFDRLHLSDVNRMLTPRVFGMTMSTTEPINFFGERGDAGPYGELGGSAIVEYAARLFRARRNVLGGDLFVGVGVWGLSEHPVDLVVDAGLRLDTEIGVFELTVANTLGRVSR
jgi:hypothetical protein